MKYLICFLFLFPVFIEAQMLDTTDSTYLKSKEYPLSDPRNPNCPCHKLQQQAEEEYWQLQNITDHPTATTQTKYKTGLLGKHRFYSLRRQWKSFVFYNRRWLQRVIAQAPDIKPQYSKCFDWK